MRLATFNILHGWSPRAGRVDVPAFADAVRTLDADVLALQEVDRAQPRSEHSDLTAVAAEAMGAVAHRFVAAIAGTPGESWAAATGAEEPADATYGIALLSRYPVREWHDVRLPGLAVRAPIVSGRRPRLVKDEPRAGAAAVLDSPYGVLTVATTHLSFVPGWNRAQLRRLLGVLARLPQPQVLLGDLNMVRTPLLERSGFTPLARGATFPAHEPRVQIDHVVGRGDLPRVADAGPRELPLSDHRALVVDL